jgi:ankyrin repeat protein
VTAVKAHDAARVKALLRQHANVNATDVDGATALHWAAYEDDVDLVRALLRSGATVTIANRYGIRPLSLACANGNAAIVDELLKAGADPNLTTTGEPPIMLAARAGSADAVKLLAAYGANVNAREGLRGQTALMWAVAEAHPTVARVLVELGAEVSARSRGGEPSVDFVTSRYIEPPKEGFTALLFAARNGNLESVRLLLDAGADPNEIAPGGSTALLVAINNYHYETASLLVDYGADVNGADKGGRTPLHAAVRSGTLPVIGSPARKPTGSMNRLELISILLDRGADVNARTAAERTRDENTRDSIHDRLIEKSVGEGGATPFFLAAQAADVTVMRILVAVGADGRIATFENTTPLAVAAGVGYFEGQRQPAEAQILEAVQIAFEQGDDINAANKHGQTAVHGAVYRGSNLIIQWLSEHGAKLDDVDVLGRTPLKLAEEGFYQVDSILRRDKSAALLAELTHDTPEAARVRKLHPTPQ